ncbi:hypothetical protein PHYBLDRAFT_166542 [Phycomyces blakesleeanus NRRL 1555(-)]|uniref:Uncharacterized protein n=1 Tax=Phycomyces blakesleeanus (strain ATCC 8743b / DSM 1359 / FGSC 10004 / NBRC 33097 / NRRL 1555) TaxID=763407 RepID=A0A162PY25_PHYB8|nr:hypothetical protein PHYBLDRAFT_166542 [Phycomyces blakesleeanus NRRL 1555(-)]OAD75286.1 hypothetical protein PHYBLDRAFT_166542 [Phycomyces blakesleeanus NRRL 1555(-)]|eukprot:XP_018293326.1 hypothetical protein PHYBLDRAFT_166542 [Phycomyces blakesleeanus NRRL 1555(-)]
MRLIKIKEKKSQRRHCSIFYIERPYFTELQVKHMKFTSSLLTLYTLYVSLKYNKINNTASSTSHQINCRLVAVARSELANATCAPLVQAQEPVVPVALVALVAPVVPVASTNPNLSLLLEQVLTVVEIINAYVKKPDLKSTDEEIIAENNTRPGWSLMTGFMSTHNQALAIALILYLKKQEDSFGIHSNDFGRIVKNHYRNQSHISNTAADLIAAHNQKARRYGRKKILLKRRELAYKQYKQNINTLMEITD